MCQVSVPLIYGRGLFIIIDFELIPDGIAILLFVTFRTIYYMALSKDSTILEVLQEKPDAAAIFARFGMGCVGCAISRGETVAEAAAAHGIPLEELLGALEISA
ncbi:hypothetical protein DSECCO2_60560 [anaerobic digester metagenome]|jgi:hybrid cluster-associated redox disulfide protein